MINYTMEKYITSMGSWNWQVFSGYLLAISLLLIFAILVPTQSLGLENVV